ncbi:MAG: hypothetical protein KGY65_02960 [Candidatus Thermoplasmatota archaeon]|nr:hypothetical protein [Candidatus Thermoplasmatota archaeon]MBS3801689.1 hypothetical protein [Candidatus Thermoplasmatota archaeon]
MEDLLQKYIEHEEEWMETYHKREIVEPVFSSIKQRWNEFIYSNCVWTDPIPL